MKFKDCKLFLIILTLGVSHAYAASSGPSSINVSGGLFNPNGTAVISPSVNFKIEIYDKAGSCLLYSESHLGQDLSSTKGGFSLPVGQGTSIVNNIDAGSPNAMTSKVFENVGAIAGGWTGCSSGATLANGDERLIRVYYDLGGGLTAMNPDVPIASSAYAMVAETLQGLRPADLIQVRDDVSNKLTQANVENIFSSTNYPKLTDLLSGASSAYISANPSAAVGFNNQRITNLADPSAAQDAVTKNYADSYLGGKSVDVSGVGPATGDGYTLIWDKTAGKWTTGVPSAIDNSKLPLAGGQMSGAIDMNGNDIWATGHITMSPQRVFNLGTFDNTQETALIGTLTAAQAGASWYNTQTKVFKIWDGANAVTQAYLSAANKLDANWFPNSGVVGGSYGSATEVPTFTVGADGRITAASNVTISGVTPGGSAGGDLTGTYPNPTIANNAVTTTKISDDAITTAKIKSSGGGKNLLLMTDAITGSSVGFSTCSTNEILRYEDANGWVCRPISTVLGTSGVTANTYGDAKNVAQVTVDAQGRVTAAADVAIDFPVTKVNGKTGDITLNAVDLGLGTASLRDIGTDPGDVPELDAGGRIPAALLPSITYGDLVNGSGKYMNYKPNDAACADGGVLKWDNTNSQWICGTDNDGATGGSAGGDLTGTYPNPTIAANAVTTSKINDNAITTAKIGDGQVTDAKINTVSIDKIVSAATKYFTYKPNNAACADGGVLKWDNTNSQWICGTDNDGATGGSAGGDLTGTYPNPTIATNAVTTSKINDGAVTDAKIDTVSVDKITSAASKYLTYKPNNAACADGEVMTWDNTNSRWVCGTTSPTGAAGGDLTGTYPNPSIATNAVTTTKINDGAITTAKIGDGQVTNAKIDTVSVDKIVSAVSKYFTYKPNNAACADGGVLKWDNTNSQWICGTDNDGSAGGAAGGDLAGTYPNPTIAANAVTTTKINDGAITTAKVGDGQITDAKIDQVSVDKIINGASKYLVYKPNDTACADGGVLKWDNANSRWICGTDNDGSSGGAAGGDLTGTYPNPTIATNAVTTTKINDSAVTTAKIGDGQVTDAKIDAVSIDKITSAVSKYFTYKPNNAACADGGVLKWDNTNSQWICGTDNDGSSGGAAGGDLTGTYPNPTIATNAVTTTKINDGAITTAKIGDGQVTDAKIDTVSVDKIVSAASKYFTYKPNNAACADGEVMTWDNTNSHWVCGTTSPTGSAGGDLTGTYPNPTIATNAVTTLKINDGAVTTAKVGDGQITDAKIDTVSIDKIINGASKYLAYKPNDTACADGGVLKWDNTNSRWICGTDNDGSSGGAAGGDLTGTYPNPTIANNAVTTTKINDGAITTAKIGDGQVTDAKIDTISVDKIVSAVSKYFTYKPNNAACADGGVLKWDNTNSQWICGTDNDGATGGTAGGDLTGTYPNPSIANGKITTPKLFTNPGPNRLVATDNTSGATLSPFECTGTQIMQWSGSGWACTNVSTALGSGYIVDGGNSRGAAVTIGTNDNFALNFEVNDSTKMTIDTAGNVGIGTTNPASLLHLQSTSGENRLSMNYPAADGGVIMFGDDSSGSDRWYMVSRGSNAGGALNSRLEFLHINNTANGGTSVMPMIMTATGNVGIGTATPSTMLDVGGTINATAMTINGVPVSAGTGDNLGNHTASQNLNLASYQLVGNGGSSGLAISSGGNVGIGTTSPVDLLSLGAVNASATNASLNLSNTALSGASASGTYIGANPATASADFINYQVGGTTKFSVDKNGKVTGDGSGLTGISAAPAGLNTQIQFNNAGTMGASSDLIWNNTSGFLGIGKTPSVALDVFGVGGPLARFKYNTGVGPALISFNNGNTNNKEWSLGTDTSAAFVINETSVGERLRIAAGGNVGIGTTTPGSALDVNGAFTTRGMAAPSLSPTGQGVIYFDSTSNKFKVSQNGGAYADLVPAAGLVNFTEAVNTTAPNATVPVVSLTANNAATNVDVALSPKGIGALTAHAADGTTTGGNKRGINSIDWQTSRASPSSVASGMYSVIAGGTNNAVSGNASSISGGSGNTVSSNYSTIAGGQSNSISATNHNSVIAGGVSNTITGDQGAILGGSNNTVSATNATVVGGANNTSSGQYSLTANTSTTAASYAQSTFGQYNLPTGSEDANAWVSTDPLFVIGNGTSSGAKSNALTVLKSGDIGIGTLTPSTKLDVNGTINATAMTINGVPVSAGSGDNLGNHTATQDLNLASYQLVGNGGSSGIAISSGGNVGIGTTTPGYKLEIAGTASTSDRKIGINGTQMLYLPDQTNFIGSLFVGDGGGSLSHASNPQGLYNTGVGIGALPANTTGYFNTAIGNRALQANTTGSTNTAIGARALVSQTTGTFNTAIGGDALYTNSTGSSNTAIGTLALRVATGSGNIGVGYNAGAAITTGSNNVVIGFDDGGSIATSSNYILLNDGAGNRRMTIDNAGNVGIGTTTPGRLLHVNGPMRLTPAALPLTPAAGDLAFDSGAANALKFYDGSAWQTVGTGSGAGDFKKDGSVAMTGNFNAGGNKVLGNTTASASLTLESTSHATKGNVYINPNGGKIGIGTTAVGATDFLAIENTGGQNVVIDKNATGSWVGIGAEPETTLHVLSNDTTWGGAIFENTDTSANATYTTLNNSRRVSTVGAGVGTSFIMNDSVSNRAEYGYFGAIIEGNTAGSHNGSIAFFPAKNGARTEAMRLTSSGNIGIGTTNPTQTLTVQQKTNNGIMIQGSNGVNGGNASFSLYNYQGSSEWSLGAAPGKFTFWDDLNAKGPFTIESNSPTDSVYVKSTGNVGIGTNAPARLLHVNGPMRLTPAALPLTPAAGDLAFDSGASNALKFYNGSAWQTVGTGTGNGDFKKDGSVAMTGNFQLGNQWLSNDGGSEGIRIDNSGKVGIGTSSPTANFEVNGYATIAGIDIVSTGLTQGAWGSDFTLQVTSAGGTPSYLKMLAANGNVGIGTTAPDPLGLTGSIYGRVLTVASPIANQRAVLELWSNVAPTANQTNGQISFIGGTSPTGTPAAAILSNNNGTTVNTGNLQFYTSSTSGNTVERMRIDHSGNVGIGTTSPSDGLHLYRPDAAGLTIDSGTTGAPSRRSVLTLAAGDANRAMGVLTKVSGTEGWFFGQGYSSSNYTIGYGSSQAEYAAQSKMTITTAGNVGIGTTTPTTYANFGPTIENKGGYGGLFQSTSSSGAVKGGFYADSNNGTVSFGSFTSSSYPVTFNIAGAEKVRVDTSGNVGIGTTSPAARLEINGNTATGLRITTADQGPWGILMRNNSAPANKQLQIYQTNAGDVVMSNDYNTNSEMLTMTGTGKVGIGTSSPAKKFHVNYSVNNDYAMQISNGGGTGYGLLINAGSTGSATAYPLVVNDWAGTNLFYVRGDGGYYHSGVAISTKESKKEIRVFDEDALGLLKDIQVVSYRYKMDSEDHVARVGFLANDENHVYDERLTNKQKGFATETIVGVMIKAFQQVTEKLNGIVNTLMGHDEQITQLEENVIYLKNQVEKVETENQKLRERLDRLESLLDGYSVRRPASSEAGPGK